MGQNLLPLHAHTPGLLEGYLPDSGDRRKYTQWVGEPGGRLEQLSLSRRPCCFIQDVLGGPSRACLILYPIYAQGLCCPLNLLTLRLPDFLSFFAVGGPFGHWEFDGFHQGGELVIRLITPFPSSEPATKSSINMLLSIKGADLGYPSLLKVPGSFPGFGTKCWEL